ncbi:hypothetical protein DAPPUDRAFT_105811 [Daphnia pulex]|uniref:Uncharacterized protein n=1 Tax=Daphnia pulex TaxID=6669 RepID=E9GRV5_DAPPU|nr:hypothetical protein DAPPUDRAFT_105811 [Daphnia pulex]|eukprot:EFX77842.1 hypothetical protein DAPPUDRAFT_105811 [Daphnia pulex]
MKNTRRLMERRGVIPYLWRGLYLPSFCFGGNGFIVVISTRCSTSRTEEPANTNTSSSSWICGCGDDCLKNSCCSDYAAFCLTGVWGHCGEDHTLNKHHWPDLKTLSCHKKRKANKRKIWAWNKTRFNHKFRRQVANRRAKQAAPIIATEHHEEPPKETRNLNNIDCILEMAKKVGMSCKTCRDRLPTTIQHAHQMFPVLLEKEEREKKTLVFLCGQKSEGNELNKDYLNNLVKSLKQSERNRGSFGKFSLPGLPARTEVVGKFVARVTATSSIASRYERTAKAKRDWLPMKLLPDMIVHRYCPGNTVLIGGFQPSSLTIAPKHLV